MQKCRRDKLTIEKEIVELTYACFQDQSKRQMRDHHPRVTIRAEPGPSHYWYLLVPPGGTTSGRT